MTLTTSGPNPFTPQSRIAALGAHPDDLETMMGYLLAWATQQVKTGGVNFAGALVLTQGKASTKGNPEYVASGKRQFEAEAGLAVLGVAASHITINDLPDGALAENTEATDAAIRDYVHTHHISHFITMGPSGGDGHPDHIASHEAAVRVAKASGGLTILALNAENKGAFVAKGVRHMKLEALSKHHSQWSLTPMRNITTMPVDWKQVGDFALPPRSAQELDYYQNYLEAETYDIL